MDLSIKSYFIAGAFQHQSHHYSRRPDIPLQRDRWPFTSIQSPLSTNHLLPKRDLSNILRAIQTPFLMPHRTPNPNPRAYQDEKRRGHQSRRHALHVSLLYTGCRIVLAATGHSLVVVSQYNLHLDLFLTNQGLRWSREATPGMGTRPGPILGNDCGRLGDLLRDVFDGEVE